MKHYYLLLFVLAVALMSCNKSTKRNENTYVPASMTKLNSSKPGSWGRQQTIYAFADNHIWKYAETPLRNSVERMTFTTENETLFELKRASFDAIDQYYKFKNLIFYCNLESNDPVSEFVKSKMDPAIIAKVKKQKVGMFVKENLWANDQTVCFLIGINELYLLRFNILQQNKLYSFERNELIDRITNQTYQLEVYPMSFFKQLPYTIQIPKNYFVYKSDVKNHYYSFIYRSLSKPSENPDKYVTVFYKKIKPDQFTSDWVIKTRKTLAWTVYDKDEFSDKDIRIEQVDFNRRAAWKISGRWQNKKYSVGGAFQTYCLYDTRTQTAFMVDNSVYFPAGYKLKALMELEAISKTIQIK